MKHNGENATITHWAEGLRIRHMAHSFSSTYFTRLDSRLGVITTILSTLVATAVFANLSDTKNNTLIVLTGFISVLAAVFAAANTFLKYGELSERHKQAASSFGEIRRRLEIDILENKIEAEILDKLNVAWSELEKKVPALPQKFYDKAKEVVKREPLLKG